MGEDSLVSGAACAAQPRFSTTEGSAGRSGLLLLLFSHVAAARFCRAQCLARSSFEGIPGNDALGSGCEDYETQPTRCSAQFETSGPGLWCCCSAPEVSPPWWSGAHAASPCRLTRLAEELWVCTSVSVGLGLSPYRRAAWMMGNTVIGGWLPAEGGVAAHLLLPQVVST